MRNFSCDFVAELHPFTSPAVPGAASGVASGNSFCFVLDLFKGVIFPARAAIELHATSRARQAYAPSYEADAVTRGSAG